MVRNKKIQFALLCLGLVNSDLMYSNPIKDTAILLYACVGNWLHLANSKDEMILYNQLENQLDYYEKQLKACPDRDDQLSAWEKCRIGVDQQQVIEAQKQYTSMVDLGILPNAGKTKDSSSYLSDPLPMTVATANLVTALPMRYRISRGQSRLNQAKKEADSITIDTVEEYDEYLNTYTCSMRKKGQSTITEKDAKNFDWSKVKPVHRTDFASEAANNVLIAKDKKLNEKILDTIFSGKASAYRDSCDDRNQLNALRSITTSADEFLGHIYQDGDLRVSTTTAKAVYDAQQAFKKDSALADDIKDARYEIAKNAYEASDYYKSRKLVVDLK